MKRIVTQLVTINFKDRRDCDVAYYFVEFLSQVCPDIKMVICGSVSVSVEISVEDDGPEIEYDDSD